MFLLDAAAEPFARLRGLHGAGEWCLLLLPVLLLDLPRSLIAAGVLAVLGAFGLPRDDLARRRAFLGGGPRVSVVVAAYNESTSLARTIASLRDLGHPGL